MAVAAAISCIDAEVNYLTQPSIYRPAFDATLTELRYVRRLIGVEGYGIDIEDPRFRLDGIPDLAVIDAEVQQRFEGDGGTTRA